MNLFISYIWSGICRWFTAVGRSSRLKRTSIQLKYKNIWKHKLHKKKSMATHTLGLTCNIEWEVRADVLLSSGCSSSESNSSPGSKKSADNMSSLSLSAIVESDPNEMRPNFRFSAFFKKKKKKGTEEA